jgi:glycosyl transferase family 25
MKENQNRKIEEIFILTIPRNEERKKEIVKHINNRFAFSFFIGFDGKNDSLVSLKNLTNPETTLSPGEIGCAMSHRMIYEHIIKNNLNTVLVLEDDAHIDFKKWHILDKILQQLPEDWDLVYLGYKDGEIRGYIPFISKEGATKRYKKYLRRAGAHELTVGYLISKKGAEILLKKQTPIQYTSDGLIENAILNNEIKAFVSVPKIIHPNTTIKSSIWS